MRHENGQGYWDTRLWEIVWHVLYKYGTPIRFKYQMGSVPDQYDSFLEWFIPEGATFERIEHFLSVEFEKAVEKGYVMGEGNTQFYHMGLGMKIYPFTDNCFHIERSEREAMTEQLMNHMKGKVERILDENKESED